VTDKWHNNFEHILQSVAKCTAEEEIPGSQTLLDSLSSQADVFGLTSSIIALTTSDVDEVPPTSGVRIFCSDKT
jgi:hypothetical protein